MLRDHRNFASDPRKGTLTRRQQAMLPAADDMSGKTVTWVIPFGSRP